MNTPRKNHWHKKRGIWKLDKVSVHLDILDAKFFEIDVSGMPDLKSCSEKILDTLKQKWLHKEWLLYSGSSHSNLKDRLEQEALNEEWQFNRDNFDDLAYWLIEEVEKEWEDLWYDRIIHAYPEINLFLPKENLSRKNPLLRHDFIYIFDWTMMRTSLVDSSFLFCRKTDRPMIAIIKLKK